VETIELSIAEYEAIRSSPVRFPVKLGHDYLEFERVVEENEHYAVAEDTALSVRRRASCRSKECGVGLNPALSTKRARRRQCDRG
jgi:hypothetical protein